MPGMLGVEIHRFRKHLRIHQMHQRPEQHFVSPVRGGGHQQGPGGAFGKHATHPVVLFRVGRETVGFVEHHRIPSRPLRMYRLVHRRVDGRQIQGHYPPVVRTGQTPFAYRAHSDPPQVAVEKPLDVRSPFGNQMRRGDHQRPFDEAAPLRLAQPKAAHDRLPRARLVGQQKPQQGLGQHGSVYGLALMGIGTQRADIPRRRLRSRHHLPHPLAPKRGQHLSGVGSAVLFQHFHPR